MPRVEFDGNSREAVKATQQIAAAMEEVTEEIQLTVREQKKLEAMAKRVAKANETADERKVRREREIIQLVKTRALSEEQGVKALVRVERQYQRVAASSNEAFGAGSLAKLTTYIQGIASVGGGLALARAEIENLRQLNESRAQAQLTVAQADAALRANIIGFSAPERQSLLDAGSSLAVKNRVGEEVIKATLAGVISSVGDAALAIELTDVASQFNKNPTQIAGLTGGLGDIITNAPGVSRPLDALGFLAITQAQARLENPADTAKSLGKVLAAVTSPDQQGSEALAGGLVAALTRGSADKTGEQSTTASITLLQKTADFFAKREEFERTAVDTIDERIDLLLNDIELAKQFIEETTFEAGAQGAISKLFLGDSEIRGAFDTVFSQLKNQEGRIAFAEEGIRFVNAGGIQGFLAQEEGIRTSADNFRRQAGSDLSAERRAEVVELIKVLTRTDSFSGGFLRDVGLFAQTGSTLSRQETIDVLTSAIGRSLVEYAGQSDAAVPADVRAARESAREIVSLLKELAAQSPRARQE